MPSLFQSLLHRFFRPATPIAPPTTTAPIQPAPDATDSPEHPNKVHGFTRHKLLAIWDGANWQEKPDLRRPLDECPDFARFAKPGDELWWYSDISFPEDGGRGGGSWGYAHMRCGLCITCQPMEYVN